MLYQFLFDEFLFNTSFSELQYWGIGIMAIIFGLDIYMTIRKPAPAQELDEKKSDEREST